MMHKNTIGTISDSTLKELIQYAILAPSSHNTQPWFFSIKKNSIKVYADFTRSLKVADPTNRELFTSIGAAIANLKISALAKNLNPEISYFPEKDNKELVARIVLHKKNSINQILIKKLFKSIPSRVNNRSLYISNKAVTKQILIDSKKLIEYNSINVSFITDKKMISKLALLTNQGIQEAFGNPKFREEISYWIRHNWTKKKDGMPGNTIGMPNLISILAPAIVRSQDSVLSVAKGEEKMVESAPAIGIIEAAIDNPLDWIRVGETYENISLLLTSANYATAVLSAAIETPNQRKKLKQLLQIKNYPSLFFRIGVPTQKAPRSPRRGLDEVLINK